MASPIPPALSSALSASLTAQSQLIPPTPALTSALDNSTKAGLPPIAISPAQGQYLSLLSHALDTKNILEIGTLGGYSTLWFALSNSGVRVTSIEASALHREVALRNIRAAGEEVAERVEVILGKALEVLPKLREEGRVFDLVFIDADWLEQEVYFDQAVGLTRQRGVVVVDNALRRITEGEADGEDGNPMGLVEAVAGDGRVRASLMPGFNLAKEGRGLEELVDGFLVATVL